MKEDYYITKLKNKSNGFKITTPEDITTDAAASPLQTYKQENSKMFNLNTNNKRKCLASDDDNGQQQNEADCGRGENQNGDEEEIRDENDDDDDDDDNEADLNSVQSDDYETNANLGIKRKQHNPLR